MGRMLEYLKDFFKFDKKNSSEKVCSEDVQVIYDEATNWQSPLYTFYSIGPSYFTFSYPVDTDCIEKEILSKDGLIGSAYYAQIPDAIENLKDYDNSWFQEEENKEVKEYLLADLFLLAEKHQYVGAYTLIASLQENIKEQRVYMQKAAEGGSPAGMVAHGLFLCITHHTSEGFQWIQQGAEAGHEMGMFMTGLSYHFGTFTPIDYEQAAQWYRMVIEKYNNYYAAINLGVLYADSGCFHSAKKYFTLADSVKDKIMEDIENFGLKDTLKNLNTCFRLLEFPYSERRRRTVIQSHAPELEFIFCNEPSKGDMIAPRSVYQKEFEETPNPWIPSNDDLVETDIQERQANTSVELFKKPVVKYPFDNFVFPHYEVEIRHPHIFGNQHELVFLERYAHAELNQYIQKHLGQLRAVFKQYGYYLTYLPAHAINMQDEQDLLGSYIRDNASDLVIPPLENKKRNESMYWNTLFTEEYLPHDCAGFLHFIPQPDDLKNKKRYNYILFPHRPGTDWQRAFADFIRYLSNQPFVEMPSIKQKFESGFLLVIDKDYHIYLTDAEGHQIVEVKMPSLPKVLYFALLKHPEGIAIKELSDYRDELMEYYREVSYKSLKEQSIDDLVDSTKNSANEKISRIRNIFEKTLVGYECDVNMFIPIGKKGEKYKILLDRSCIRWEPDNISIF